MDSFRRRARRERAEASERAQDEVQRAVHDIAGPVLHRYGFWFGTQGWSPSTTTSVLYEAETSDLYEHVPADLRLPSRSYEGVLSVELWINVDSSLGTCELTLSHLRDGHWSQFTPTADHWNAEIAAAVHDVIREFDHLLRQHRPAS
ncbi:MULTISPECIES: hypothetical protein [Aeromicrobium]|uniref:SRPBCC domain-containing protein n=2 Tax=Aeromicrobium TaxID=2040 RepID=A0ABX6SQS5_9ACTN|nr:MULTISPECIES: hypothetical protein [Aeromicrobium]MCD9155014.1 hypothetical protein [Aeromicrobium duanguangcaii]MCL3839154.1 hypothetical protein [Aeromicrobium duanguangcaii]MTB89286.1 hypothetical protein [Aeromicrobium senzhongii]QNL93452.1 hypothetical protein H9L21_10015 [Aeromicrobium senzhongii]UUI67582.1 hypothetical protein NP095_10240 [Aeromicrobium duanguangcaii]